MYQYLNCRKPLFVFLLLSFSTQALAQSIPDSRTKADNYVKMPKGLKNSYEGSVKFVGSGVIPETTTLKNWRWLYFDSDDSIVVKFPVVFADQNSLVVALGSVRFASVLMSGADTLYVRRDLCQIDNIVSENSLPGAYNTIVVDEGADLYISGMQMKPGENDITIFTAGKGTKVKIVKGAGESFGIRP